MLGIAYVLLALGSAIWVYVDTGRAAPPSGSRASWTIGTYLLLPIVLPMYLSARRRAGRG